MRGTSSPLLSILFLVESPRRGRGLLEEVPPDQKTRRTLLVLLRRRRHHHRRRHLGQV
jgi:hypothetical protein